MMHITEAMERTEDMRLRLPKVTTTDLPEVPMTMDHMEHILLHLNMQHPLEMACIVDNQCKHPPQVDMKPATHIMTKCNTINKWALTDIMIPMQ